MWPTMPLLATSSDDTERKRKYRFTFVTSTKTEMSMPELNWKDTRLDLLTDSNFSVWFELVQNCLSVSRLHGPLTVDELSNA